MADVDQKRAAFTREIRSGAELRAAARARIDQLNLSRNEVDELAKITPGYAGKLLCDPPVRGGTGADNLLKLLQAIGLKIVVEDDPDVTGRVLAVAMPRMTCHVRKSSHKQKIQSCLRRLSKILETLESSAVEDTDDRDMLAPILASVGATPCARQLRSAEARQAPVGMRSAERAMRNPNHHRDNTTRREAR